VVDEASRRSQAVTAALAAVALLALTIARVCPDLAMIGDSAELVTAAALWGVPHAPGYPLFTAIGHLFAALPFGTLPWRVHLTSALFHACAVGATVAGAYAITESRLAAVVAGIALGLSRAFLLGSLYAEVFPLNDLFCAAALALAVAARREQGPRARGVLRALAVCVGLGAGHHMMFMLVLPALAVLTARPLARVLRERPREGAVMTGLALGPLVAACVLVPVAAARDPYLSWGGVHDVASWLRVVTRADYGGIFSPARTVSADSGWVRELAWGRLLERSAGPAVVAFALLGLGDRLRKDRVVGWALLLAVVVPGPLFAWLNALDTRSEVTLAYFERFTTMGYVGVALASGAGVAAARAVLASLRWERLATTTVLAGWIVLRFVSTRDVDLGAERGGIAFAHDVILHTPERALVLLSGDQPIDAELYVCGVERLCGDRVAFAPGMLSLPWKMAEVRRRHPDLDIPWMGGPALRRIHSLVAAVRDRPVYLWPDLLEKDPLLAAWETTPEGLLLRVGPRRTGAAVDHGGLRSMSR
jgi:hypothetical protein